MIRLSVLASLLLSSTVVMPTLATAATITGWNTDNVVEGAEDTDPTDDVGGASVVYDQDVSGGVPTDAESNGQVVYIAPESNTPGIEVDDTDYSVFDGCILSSSTATCTSPFQSGKRIKQQVTDTGTIDLVFDISADGEGESIFQVYHRLINVTGGTLDGFEIQLGTGVGSEFEASGESDGLRFATTTDGVEFGPNDVAAFSQYPFGLFGGEPLNPNPLSLPGFFDTVDRAGFEVSLGEDVISSGEYYGTYDDRFGSWLSQEDVPDGLLYDYDPGNADPLVMAWAGVTGWEFLRGTDPGSELNFLGVEPIGSLIFGYDFVYDPVNGVSESMMNYIMANLVDEFADPLEFGTDLFIDPIEDLANLNLTFAIAIDDLLAESFSSFTLRVTTSGSAIAPVPLPAGAPLLLVGLAALGVISRKRRRNTLA
ncbi:MAG: choice-of-anchor F family protein [Rhodobacteraceae bacterium]|nr:choice-of-anchor F family protein [Paracoccaceae bacterium]